LWQGCRKSNMNQTVPKHCCKAIGTENISFLAYMYHISWYIATWKNMVNIVTCKNIFQDTEKKFGTSIYSNRIKFQRMHEVKVINCWVLNTFKWKIKQSCVPFMISILKFHFHTRVRTNHTLTNKLLQLLLHVPLL